jgi:hypothetical protein
MVEMPGQQSAPVVTCQLLDTVLPTVTVAVVAVLVLDDETCMMVIVLPEVTPASVVPPHTPLRAMLTQPVPQVAVRDPVKPESVTALLAMCRAVPAPVTLVKLKAFAVLLLVVTDQVPETVDPAVTVAFVTELVLEDEVCWIAIVSPDWKPDSVVQVHQVPLRAMLVQPVPQVADTVPVKPESVTALLLIVALMLTPV